MLWLFSQCPYVGTEKITKPGRISAPMWAQFVDIRLRRDMVARSRKNSVARRTYTSPHTGGSKNLRVRGLKLAAERGGNAPSRGELYAITHTKKDQNYTDPNLPQILELTRDPTVPTFPSANDALGLVYPKEHSGTVRGMGSGVTPSQVNMSRRRGGAAGGSSQGSSSATTTHVFGHCPVEDRVRVLEAEVQRLSHLEEEVQRLSHLEEEVQRLS
ncbi:hypothetical protein LINPERPRIM_LOCUS41021 [Linum perenne]